MHSFNHLFNFCCQFLFCLHPGGDMKKGLIYCTFLTLPTIFIFLLKSSDLWPFCRLTACIYLFIFFLFIITQHLQISSQSFGYTSHYPNFCLRASNYNSAMSLCLSSGRLILETQMVMVIVMWERHLCAGMLCCSA